MNDPARLILLFVLLVYVAFALLIKFGPRQKKSAVISRFQDRSAELHFLKGQTVSERKRKAFSAMAKPESHSMGRELPRHPQESQS